MSVQDDERRLLSSFHCIIGILWFSRRRVRRRRVRRRRVRRHFTVLTMT